MTEMTCVKRDLRKDESERKETPLDKSHVMETTWL